MIIILNDKPKSVTIILLLMILLVPNFQDSDQYQHVTENQDSDNVAWDTVNGSEGGGKYPLGEEPTDDVEEDNGGLISEEVIKCVC